MQLCAFFYIPTYIIVDMYGDLVLHLPLEITCNMETESDLQNF